LSSPKNIAFLFPVSFNNPTPDFGQGGAPITRPRHTRDSVTMRRFGFALSDFLFDRFADVGYPTARFLPRVLRSWSQTQW
jgi:hypothetical protein